MNDTVQSLVSYCQENGRVCPVPKQWAAFYRSLPNCRQVGVGWEPPLPLILGAWHESGGVQKMLRFIDHIEWAASQGALDQASTFLRDLDESEWHHFGE